MVVKRFSVIEVLYKSYTIIILFLYIVLLCLILITSETQNEAISPQNEAICHQNEAVLTQNETLTHHNEAVAFSVFASVWKVINIFALSTVPIRGRASGGILEAVWLA